jgi:hypothetical protein
MLTHTPQLLLNGRLKLSISWPSRELRDRIYSFCFEDDCYGFQAHDMYFEVR